MLVRCLAIAGALLLWGAFAGARPSSTAPSSASLRIVSLNLAMREDIDTIAAELAERQLVPGADLVLLQEVIERDRGNDVASRLAEKTGLHAAFRPAFALDAHRTMGLAILAREPLEEPHVLPLKRFDLSFRSRHRIALGAAVETRAGRILVYDVHLDTRINIADRVEQLSAVMDDLDASANPAIVGGDFNTNDNRWLFHTIPIPFSSQQRDGLLRFMQGRGFQSAITGHVATHDALGMQLDWIFVRGLEAGATAIRPMAISDHHALATTISRPAPTQSSPGR